MKPIAVVSALALSGCAALPDSIEPSYVSPITYRNLECGQLFDESQRLRSAYLVAARKQEDANTGDALGVLLVGLPAASLAGYNVAPDIARLKGEHEALHRVVLEKRCLEHSDKAPPPS